MKLDIPRWYQANIDDKFHISISTRTKVGNSVIRELFNEQPHFDTIEYYSQNNKFCKRFNDYIALKGKIKITYYFDDADNIQSSDVDEYLALIADEPVVNNSTIERTATTLSFTYEETCQRNGWELPSLSYELICDKASVEILEDDTELFCFLSNDTDWNIKSINTQANEEVTVTKEGTECYLFVGNVAEVKVGTTIKNLNKYGVVKITSSEVKLTNTLNYKSAKAILIYK